MIGDRYEDESPKPSRRLFRPLSHYRCGCDRCMTVRDENQAVRLFMGWRQPEYMGPCDEYSM